MKPSLFVIFAASAALLGACNTAPTQPTATTTPPRALGVLELNLDSSGVSTARLEAPVRAAAFTNREGQVSFGTGVTQVISSVDEAYDYLVATFPVTSSVALSNLTIVALAKSGNVGGTAIKSISNFGGVSDATEQARIAKFLVPTHAVAASAGNVVIDFGEADFQAFSATEVSEITTQASPLLQAGDQVLNYGFSARCVTGCRTNRRAITPSGTGSVSIGLRVPKAALNTAYRFVMNFVVMDDDTARVTRGLYPLESLPFVRARGSSVGTSSVKQVGVLTSLSSSLTLVEDAYTSTANESVQALGLGRISAGYLHSCGLNAAGKAYCWGEGSGGQLGNASTNSSSVPVAVSAPLGVSTPLTFSSISAGFYYTCGVTLTGEGYCWGLGSSLQLGNSAFTQTSRPVPVQAPLNGAVLKFSIISAGNKHTCGLTTDGLAYCWGVNFEGQLGTGVDEFYVAFSALPVAVVAPTNGSILKFSAISLGFQHTCGVTTGGKAYCWGYGESGQLGNSASSFVSSYVPVAVSAPANVVGSGNGAELTFSSISAGKFHTCGVTTDGLGYCWGDGRSGQLGVGRLAIAGIPRAVLLSSDSEFLNFSSITAGDSHTCGLTRDGRAYCWGSDEFGQLGGNGGADAFVPAAVDAPAGGSVLVFSSLSAGSDHVCGVTTVGVAYCWGSNASGQIGNGGPTNANAPTAVDRTDFKI